MSQDHNSIRLGIAGKVDENDHPYSWSAILNGYEPALMRQWAAPVISDYLGAQPKENFGVPGASVTHIWCDDPSDARKIAQASRIPSIVSSPGELLGKVDAVLIPTDRGDEHVERARVFVEAGVPVFIDKPLCDNRNDLRTFEQWVAAGKPILSCSAMRYCVEYESLWKKLQEAGEPRIITIGMAKSWRRDGIHAMEGVYPFLEPGGWISALNCGEGTTQIVRYRHRSGVNVIVMCEPELFGAFGVLNVYGTRGHLTARFGDSFNAFKRQLSAFVDYVRSGERPFPFNQTSELIQMLIAGELSRIEGGREISLPLE